MAEFNIEHHDVAEDLEAKIARDEIEVHEQNKVNERVITEEELSERNSERHHTDSVKKQHLANRLKTGDISVVGLDKSHEFANPDKVVNKISKKQRKLRQQEKDARNKKQRRETSKIEKDIRG